MILVTGGMGYIGSHTLLALTERHPEWDLLSVDNFSNSRPEISSKISVRCGKEIKNIKLDLADRSSVQRELAELKLTGIIHFAALKSVPDSVEDPSGYYRNNLLSLLNVLEIAEERQIPFIFSSSCSVYGNAETLPVREDAPLSEPACPYAATKQMGEQIVRDFVQKGAFSASLLRYFNPIGADLQGEIGEWPPRPTTGLVPALTRTATGAQQEFVVHGDDYDTRDGSCVRDYIHVSDIAEAHVLALEYVLKQPKGEVSLFNLGSGQGVTVLEAIRAFEKATGEPLNYRIGPRREGDVVAVYADRSRATEVLGWQPKFDLQAMMNSAWQWAQKVA